MVFNIAILISGNGSNMLNIIKASQKSVIKSQVVTVISNNPYALGVKKAIKNGIDAKIINQNDFIDTNNYEKFLTKYLKDKKVNLICLAGYMKILSKNFIDEWNKKIINIHPSLLPAFKGLNTHRRAIHMNVKFSGCTVHYVDREIDSGRIIDQEVVKIHNADDENVLKKKILMKEHKLYIRVLKYLENKIE